MILISKIFKEAYWVGGKKVTLIGGLWDKKYDANIQNKIFIYQWKANLGVKILFGK